MVVSKRIKAFLRKHKPQQHWHIDRLRAYDTFGSLTEHFKTSPNDFFEKLVSEITPIQSHYNDFVQQKKADRKEKSIGFSQTAPFSDFSVFRSEEHTSELQSRENLVCHLLLEKKKEININIYINIK